jgi:hypothetical protein
VSSLAELATPEPQLPSSRLSFRSTHVTLNLAPPHGHVYIPRRPGQRNAPPLRQTYFGPPLPLPLPAPQRHPYPQSQPQSQLQLQPQPQSQPHPQPHPHPPPQSQPQHSSATSLPLMQTPQPAQTPSSPTQARLAHFPPPPHSLPPHQWSPHPAEAASPALPRQWEPHTPTAALAPPSGTSMEQAQQAQQLLQLLPPPPPLMPFQTPGAPQLRGGTHGMIPVRAAQHPQPRPYPSQPYQQHSPQHQLPRTPLPPPPMRPRLQPPRPPQPPQLHQRYHQQ